MLPNIINEDQTDCIKGQFVGCNIILVEDMIIYADIPGIILRIDFEKAFDSICHKFIDISQEAFTFDPK